MNLSILFFFLPLFLAAPLGRILICTTKAGLVQMKKNQLAKWQVYGLLYNIADPQGSFPFLQLKFLSIKPRPPKGFDETIMCEVLNSV